MYKKGGKKKKMYKKGKTASDYNEIERKVVKIEET